MSGFSSPDNINLTQKCSEVLVDIKETPDDELHKTYELDKCISWITKNNFERTCLQFPDKLLNDGVSVALYLENALGRTFYLLADTAFGSCCVDHISAEHVKGDSIIHFGHACLSHFSKVPVLYIFEKEELEINKLKNALDRVIPQNVHILIFYDDVYYHLYNNLCKIFENTNVQITKIVTPEDGAVKDEKVRELYGRTFCLSSNKDSAAVFLGGDCITLQNLALALPDIKWYYYMNGNLIEYEPSRSKFLMKKYHQMEVVKDANVIGILIGTLGIENYLNAIERVKFLAKNHGKKCYILAVGRPNVCKLANFLEVDVFVSIACSENVSQDFKEYYKPVVSLFEVEMALGNHLFRTEYVNDFREVLHKYSSTTEIEPKSESEVSLTSGKIRSHLKHGDHSSTALQEKMEGALMEAKGAEFLSSRSWRGLEQNLDNKDPAKVETGRSGIPLGYENEYNTLTEEAEK
ncbi:UNVERIFIED_CONTAM: hypothetical protein PYX00_002745 [Menopon gallinae]|uniref:2-(3-amino-3-carboxypropyl)histidine synthase subunit 2 n=1 Tax=Menopon gallinae TaxID=328185 RepID=A0AAW2HZ01_9NEOP